MASNAAYALLCTDLGFVGSNVPDPVRQLLLNKLEAATAELADAGIAIDEGKAQDLDLLVMYAAWLYRGRIKQSDKPLMLQRLLRNRQAAQAVGGPP